MGPPAHRLSGSTFLRHVGPWCQLDLLRRSSPNMPRASRGIRSCSLWEPTRDIYPTYVAFSLDYPSGRPRNHHHRVRRAVRSENRGRRVPPLVISATLVNHPWDLGPGLHRFAWVHSRNRPTRCAGRVSAIACQCSVAAVELRHAVAWDRCAIIVGEMFPMLIALPPPTYNTTAR